MAKKWMEKLLTLDGALQESIDPFNDVLETNSPSVNFIFGRTWGAPRGYTTVVYGPPGGGKSVLTNMYVGKLHQNDPEAYAARFDTEFRSQGQLTDASKKIFGIDKARLITVETNEPELIFDQIEKKLAAGCQAGMPLKMIVIDSLYGIQGRREMAADSVGKQIIGDHALTIQVGLKRILPIIRKYKIALFLVDQVRSEMDDLERMRGNKFKMRSSFGVQHMAEFFVAVEENRNKEGRGDIHGNEFVDNNDTDMNKKGEQTGLKIRAKMKKNSLGVRGRVGEFTWSFSKGVMNAHEEVFKLGVNRNVIERPNQQTYAFGNKTWRGMDAMIQALEESQELQQEVVKELKRRDLAGDFAIMDKKVEEAESEEL